MDGVRAIKEWRLVTTTVPNSKGAKATAADTCPGCGGPVACGMANGQATCWCFALPPALPVPADAADARCYCSQCLQRMIEERSKDRCA
jgi:hypothetical protein